MSFMKNYVILEELGSGAMASIHKGIQKSLERFVAIKKIHPHLSGVEEFVQRFEHEAKSAAGLSHVNIMDIIDFGRDDNDYCIVLEYIEGPDLADILKSSEKAPTNVAISFVIQILNGLEHAHNRGVVHRDVKPANIMISIEGIVKIADFGIAQTVKLPSVTHLGQTVGTPHYMSPEQAGGKKIDHRSDLFSVGVILYKLLTDELPFSGDAIASILKQVRKIPHKSIKKHNAQIPDQLAAIVDKALQKDPTKRFFDAAEFAYTLEEYAFSNGIQFGPRVVKKFFEETLIGKLKLESPGGPSASQLGRIESSASNIFRRRPTAAILPLSGCFGCQVNLLDLHESIQELRKRIDIQYMYFMDEKDIPEVDIGIVEGCVANSENAERLELLRKRCTCLIALGTCACFGGVQGLRNLFTKEEVIDASYINHFGTVNNGRQPDSPLIPGLSERVKAVPDVVEANVKIPGCPSPHQLILDSIDSLAKGSKVRIPTKNLCHDCTRERLEMLTGKRELIADKIRPVMEVERIDPKRCFLEQGILCMGIATREGCGARCLANNIPCQGCMGPPLHTREAGVRWINAAASLLPGGALRFRHDLVGMIERYSLPVSIMPMVGNNKNK